MQYCFFLFFFNFRWWCWWGFGDVVLIKQIIKDASPMSISFSVPRHFFLSQTFCDSWMSLSNMFRTTSNMYSYSFKPQLMIKTQVESHDKKPSDQRNFYTRTIIFLMDWGVSVLVRLSFNWNVIIYSKYILIHLQ